MHCSAGHHAVAIEGYLFVVFCIVDIIVQTILTYRSALQQDGQRYTSVFPIGPCWGRLQCSSDSLAGFGRPSSEGAKGEENGGKGKGEEIGIGGEKGEGRDDHGLHRPKNKIFCYCLAL